MSIATRDCNFGTETPIGLDRSSPARNPRGCRRKRIFVPMLFQHNVDFHKDLANFRD